MPRTAIDDQLLEAQIAELRENPPELPEISAAGDPEVRAAGGGAGKAKHTKGANTFPIYNTETGDVEYPPVSILARKLMEKTEAGAKQWATTAPSGHKYILDERLTAKFGEKRMRKAKPKGTPEFYCMLNPQSAEWETMKTLGFSRECKRKSALATLEAKQAHERNRHAGGLRALERQEDIEREERAEKREEMLLTALAQLAAAQKGA